MKKDDTSTEVKQDENINNQANPAPESQENQKPEEQAVKKKKVKLRSNIKYGNNLHSKGEVILIDSKDYEEFKAAGVIETDKE